MDSSFFISPKKAVAYLHFEDGTFFKGTVNRSPDDLQLKRGIWGEAVFTTGMTGYQETITDPSFLGQHIIFTNAHVGNYPSDQRALQSAKSFATCIIARHFSPNAFFESIQNEVPFFSDVDTRKLVRYLTKVKDISHKSVLIFSSRTPSVEEFRSAKITTDELTIVSQKKAIVHREGPNPIVIINYGVKKAILEQLLKLEYPLVSLPHSVTSADVLRFQPRLIFLSNGPGDPRNHQKEIAVVRDLIQTNIPIRAICLGHQFIAAALGIKIVKLHFGQRGANHPVIDHVTNQILITSQNHGYAVDPISFNQNKKLNLLKKELFIHYTSLFDDSIEGIASTDHFVKSVQFHPEATPGPKDALGFFEEIKKYLDLKSDIPTIDTNKLFEFKKLTQRLRKTVSYKKILLIGSGPIKIGQACEFDYSGTQALKAFKEEGIEIVLLNSNPATIMTDPEMCTSTYIEPITKETIKKIILKEKVDAVLSTMGGQTALNLCVELEEDDFLKTHGVTLLGASIETIKKTEDRDLFAQELKKLGYRAGERFKVESREEAIEVAREKVKFPLIIRRDYALGGNGALLLHHMSDLKEIFNSNFTFPITMEKSLLGYKEIELEVMVDNVKNGVIVCSIENIDPCGIHTGDSITVAPAMTISDRCMQELRTMALVIAKHMGVVAGGANVQFAINPDDETDIIVIEMNPRVSRSSALASKATGYPIAKISSLLAIGYTLPEILNDITKTSPVSFEPTLDYVAVKIPMFTFGKFPRSQKILGPQMRSVGEVLALGGSFNEAFFKALRSLEMGLEIPALTQLNDIPIKPDLKFIEKRLIEPQELSLLTVLEALRAGMSMERICDLSKISRWFIEQMNLFFQMELDLKEIKNVFDDRSLFVNFKKNGFSDKYISFQTNKSEKEILDFRIKNNIFPVYKAVDTCSGEFTAETPYYYSTYAEENEALALNLKGRAIAILGSGPNRIGQGIEFDYSCVKSCERLKENEFFSVMINSNPETVSTDYDSSDRLYISAIYAEDLLDIFLNEKTQEIIASFAGQTGIHVREQFERGFRKNLFSFSFLGPTWEMLDTTEDRKLFSEIIKKTSLLRTQSYQACGKKDLIHAISEIGLPVIIRPSFVIGGESMYVLRSLEDINNLPSLLQDQMLSNGVNFYVEKYLENAIEYDVDLVRDEKGNFCYAICEHIEFAGVHSGDSGMITPPAQLSATNYQNLRKISFEIANRLGIVGPANFQFAIKDDKVFCIEANLRGSRTLPFLSKAYNISLPKIATDAMLGKEIKNTEELFSDYFSVKQSTFPFDRFIDDNFTLGPKMKSTGETMGIDLDREKAIFKSYEGNYPFLKQHGKIFLNLTSDEVVIFLPYLKALLETGVTFVASKRTAEYLRCHNVEKIDVGSPESFKNELIKIVFNSEANQGESEIDAIGKAAIQHAIPYFSRFENIKTISEVLIKINGKAIEPISLQEINKSVNNYFDKGY